MFIDAFPQDSREEADFNRWIKRLASSGSDAEPFRLARMRNPRVANAFFAATSVLDRAVRDEDTAGELCLRTLVMLWEMVPDRDDLDPNAERVVFRAAAASKMVFAAVDMHREEGRAREEQIDDEHESPSPSPLDEAIVNEEMQRALDSVEPLVLKRYNRYRELVEAGYAEDEAIKQTAREEGRHVRTIERALEAVQEALEDCLLGTPDLLTPQPPLAVDPGQAPEPIGPALHAEEIPPYDVPQQPAPSAEPEPSSERPPDEPPRLG